MTARTRLNLVLAGALTALGLVVWLEPGTPPAPPAERLTPLTATEITRIEIHPPHRATAILEQHAGEWRLSAPFAAPADTAKIRTLLDLARAPSRARYPAAAVDAAQAGLADSNLRIRLNRIDLTFGGTEPLHGRRYVRNGDTVHLIVDRYSYLFQGDPIGLVSPALLPAQAPLQALRLPGLSLQLEAGHWRSNDPAPTHSSEQIHRLVDEWQHARALRVSRSEATTGAETIDLQLAGSDTPLRFLLQRDANEFRLVRPDLGLMYHFHPAAAARLLQLPANPGTDDDA